MNPNVFSELTIFGDRISKKRLLMKFRLSDLCINSDPASLLNVKVKSDGGSFNIEEAADLVKQDDKSFILVPHDGFDLMSISRAVAEMHPEFEQKFLTAKMAPDNDATMTILQLIIPDIDKLRHDVLMEGVNTYFKAFNADIEMERVLVTTKIAKYMEGADDKATDEMKQMLDDNVKTVQDSAKQDVDKKQEDIENAYKAFQAKVAEKQAEFGEKAAAVNDAVANSLKME